MTLSNYSAYGNANQDDLWAAFQAQADAEGVVLPATIKEIMDTWTFKMGFPVITVNRNYQTGGAVVTQVSSLSILPSFGKKLLLKIMLSKCVQNRFLLRKSNDSTDTTIYQWWVPLTFSSASNPTAIKKDWLSVDQVTKTIANVGAAANQWLLFNIDQQSQL